MKKDTKLLKKNLNLKYSNRRDKYGLTILKGSRVVRIIKKDNELFFKMYKQKIFKKMIDNEFILPFKIYESTKLDYIFVIQNKIPIIVNPSEWSPTMFIDAAKLILRVERFLKDYNITFDDAHPWNILFKDGKPFVSDLGAFNFKNTSLHWDIKFKNKLWPCVTLYKSFFHNPIILMLSGKAAFVRQNFHNWYPFSNSDTFLVLLKNPQLWFLYIGNFLKEILIEKINSFLNKINLNVSNLYYLNFKKFLTEIEKKFLKNIDRKEFISDENYINNFIVKFINKLNHGNLIIFESEIVKKKEFKNKISQRILFLSDNDEFIDKLYKEYRGIYDLAVVDIRTPATSSGPNNLWISSMFNRFKCTNGIFYFDLEKIIIVKCLTITELLDFVKLLVKEKKLLIFKKIKKLKYFNDRDFGQTSDTLIIENINLKFTNSKIIKKSEDILIIEIY